jgi:DNA polymerase-2
VIEPQVGLYRHLFVFDFKSLYPSIMRTFNIDPLNYARAGADALEAPNGAHFARERGILPELLEGFWTQREEAKKRGDELASHTYKIIMNSFYGVLATGSCRFASDALAGAITEFGHHILRWAQQQLEARGQRVIYGDTDSVFVDPGLEADCPAVEARALGEALCAEVNAELVRYIEREYRVESRLELEFEKYYAPFLLPPMRGSERGRAKGYAGLRLGPGGEQLDIVGMEAVRRDWTKLAHQLQRQLLDLLFHDAGPQAIEACAVEWVRALRAGEKDGDLVYRKSLRKPVAKYIRNVPPHVQAARLLPNPRGVIQYVVTRDGPQPVGHLTAPPDYEHYVRKQIEPLLRTIAQVSPIDVESAMKGATSLFGAEVWAELKTPTK